MLLDVGLFELLSIKQLIKQSTSATLDFEKHAMHTTWNFLLPRAFTRPRSSVSALIFFSFTAFFQESVVACWFTKRTIVNRPDFNFTLGLSPVTSKSFSALMKALHSNCEADSIVVADSIVAGKMCAYVSAALREKFNITAESSLVLLLYTDGGWLVGGKPRRGEVSYDEVRTEQ